VGAEEAAVTLLLTDTHPHPHPDVANWELSVHLPADAHAPRLCRRAVVDAVHEYGLAHLTADSGLVASELMTNALQHGLGPLSFRVAWYSVRHRLRITVWDAGPGRAPAKPAPPPPDQESGRGLVIVAALAAEWAQYAMPGGGKALWAELGC
jgi:anti-sigma regulatory factor (Ser/Thr protein kinase)